MFQVYSISANNSVPPLRLQKYHNKTYSRIALTKAKDIENPPGNIHGSVSYPVQISQ